MTKVLVMAGGTGGHVIPALSVAEVLRERRCEVVWLGTERGIEARLVPAAGFPMEWLEVAGLRGKGVISWVGAPYRVLSAIVQALAVIRRRQPDVVLGMGGFAAGPGGIAAWLTRRPLVIHEQNAVPGLTNRILSHLANAVAEAFPGSFRASVGAVTIGNPVRPQIVDAGVAKTEPRIPRHLLVFGGSQGAQVLNHVVPAALALLTPSQRPAVLHQCGRGRKAETEARYGGLGIEADVREFIDDMAASFHWADLAVTRSGALTVAELAAAALPAVLVPFPAAVDDHQTENARYLVRRGAAALIPEKDLTPAGLAETITELSGENGTVLRRMAVEARACAQIGTAQTLADLCLAQVKRRAA